MQECLLGSLNMNVCDSMLFNRLQSIRTNPKLSFINKTVV